MSNSQLDDIDFDDMLNVDKSPSPKKRKTNNTTIPQMSIKDESEKIMLDQISDETINATNKRRKYEEDLMNDFDKTPLEMFDIDLDKLESKPIQTFHNTGHMLRGVRKMKKSKRMRKSKKTKKSKRMRKSKKMRKSKNRK